MRLTGWNRQRGGIFRSDEDLRKGMKQGFTRQTGSTTIAIGERAGLWVPASAVVTLGTRRTVMVRNDNKFIPVEVRTGVETDGKLRILSGIDASSEIAEKALLLIDNDGFITPGQDVTGEKMLISIPNKQTVR
ncbi:MAG: hypothetical protein MZV63_44470 [Marinilabiliales bacterium]|nr:hypothetical protein [Marinilabiliales bacterium]